MAEEKIKEQTMQAKNLTSNTLIYKYGLPIPWFHNKV